ncbi:Hypothetical_protein [Hexamita inflata]|uniref:Hypothetical_protein n=1 Tax=Hexamita inflata TaxID=28002 RepID=A0AA86NQ49_9EUKA|nr:Hypothetical protein HINF_LOCUS10896 [Hexamita inflata]
MNFQLEAQIIQKIYQLNYQYYSVLYEIIKVNFIFLDLLFQQGYILYPLQELFIRGQVQRPCQVIQRFQFILTSRSSFGATYENFSKCANHELIEASFIFSVKPTYCPSETVRFNSGISLALTDFLDFSIKIDISILFTSKQKVE